MILALATGWTPRVIRSMTLSFRAACHWVLYVRAVAPNGFPNTDVPFGAPSGVRVAAAKQAVAVANLRAHLFPEDTDG